MNVYDITTDVAVSIVILAVVSICAYMQGERKGHERGVAEGWLERQQQLADADKARRNKNGQFKGNRREA